MNTLFPMALPKVYLKLASDCSKMAVRNNNVYGMFFFFFFFFLFFWGFFMFRFVVFLILRTYKNTIRFFCGEILKSHLR